MKIPSTRIVTALLAGFLTIVLAACGGGGGGGDTGGGASVPVDLVPVDLVQVEKPAISIQPINQSVATGNTATLMVVATGGATLAYQWKKNGTDIAGATSSTYTTPATSSADNGATYSVSVSNSAGTVTSSDATLAVSATPTAPSIGTQPVNQSVVTGQTATFSVIATNSATTSYQWKKNGTNISGATSSTYTTPATSMADSGTVFTVVVSNAAGTVTSAEARLTVTSSAVAPIITTQPAAQAVATGQTASFSVVAAGTKPLAYQWKKNGTDIAGATSSTYTTPAILSEDNGAVFSVVVSNGAGTVTSSNAVLSDVAISTQPAAQSVVVDQTASFSVTAAGTGPFTYQWKKDGVNIDGATSSTYTTPASVIGDNNAVFTVQVGNSAGTVTSSSASLLVFSTKYSEVANTSGGTYAKTECVKDNITGLVWEGKTASGTRAGSDTYTNYDDENSAQKLNSSQSGYENPTQAEIDASSNSMGYKNAVNASALCGYTDWRLPTKNELLGIVDANQAADPKIDSTWFPNTQSLFYLTKSPFVGTASSAWGVSFLTGNTTDYGRGGVGNVRLVRASQ